MPRKPNELSLYDKRAMLALYDTGGLRDMCESSAARLLDVSKRTMKMVLADRRAIEADAAGDDPRRVSQTNELRKTLIADMNNIMFQCFTEMINLNLPLDDTILLDRARNLAAQMEIPDFVPDMAWIGCWKETRRIPAEHMYSRTKESVVAENSTWHRRVVEYAVSNYHADDIYSLVEIGLHYVSSVPQEPGAPPFAEPDYVVRTVCAVYVCNVTGTDKRVPLLFDKSHRFAGVRPLPDSNHINFNMLKTGDYKSYIKRLDKCIAPRKILLVLDNYSEHPKIRLKNIEFRVLPRGTIHPLGVLIANVKRTDADDNGDTSESWDAVKSVYKRLFMRAWETITPVTIRDCFRTLRFLNAEAECEADVGAGAGAGAIQQRQTVIAHTSSAVQTSAVQTSTVQTSAAYDRDAPTRPHGGGTGVRLQVDAADSYGNNEPLIPTTVLNVDGNNLFDCHRYTYGMGTCGHNGCR